ncbi:MAG TPA: 3-deoxy-8-phosphooctulonate synthase [Methylomirabilota bacterium]|jgi:2-dehydro-3-deoxyphosphooctonate aldolase (KDO 8-P synthase)|nr:3-deoxy-8-phosphooctulonate synthase [Methylomirabilota bacterium]
MVDAATVPVRIGPVPVGGGAPLVLIAGPCAIEDEAHALRTAERLVRMTGEAKVPFVYKSSYDKANRSSLPSYRGPGLREGLRILARVRDATGCPVLSDVHLPDEVPAAAEILDCLQVPAFLCRQTDLVVACGRSGRPVNVKKGQFMAPWDMGNVVEKLRASGCRAVTLTERGATFGYNNLVVDLRALAIMRGFGTPVVFDATHAVQLPGGEGTRSGGERRYVAGLARAAVAFGVDALFMEVHEDPDRAPSDGATMLPLAELPRLLDEVQAIREALR